MTKTFQTPASIIPAGAPDPIAARNMAIVDAMAPATRAKVYEFGLSAVSRHKTTSGAYQAAKKAAGLAKSRGIYRQRASAVPTVSAMA